MIFSLILTASEPDKLRTSLTEFTYLINKAEGQDLAPKILFINQSECGRDSLWHGMITIIYSAKRDIK